MTDGDARPPAGRTVAAFDFDGTLTRRDTLLPFLVGVCGPIAVATALVAVAGPAASALLADADAGRATVKQQLFRRLLAGRPVADLATAGQRFAHAVAGSTRLRSDTYDHWRQHLAAGHEVVIVSATLQLYVDPLARLLGGSVGLGTRLVHTADGLLTGTIDGANCRGPEKVRRLHTWLRETGSPEPGDVTVHAYGNSAGDDDLLRRANVGTRVGRR